MSKSGADSFARVVAGLQGGDPHAASKVFERFAGRLILLARRRIDRRLSRKVEPEDVLQSVFRSFFCRYAEDGFRLEGWDSLWAVLVVLTIRKCRRKTEQWRAARRDYRQEQAALDRSCDTIDRAPRPDEAAELADLVEQLMRSAGAREQQILSLRLQGYAIAEIAGSVGRTERTVLRILQKFREQLMAMCTSVD